MQRRFPRALHALLLVLVFCSKMSFAQDSFAAKDTVALRFSVQQLIAPAVLTGTGLLSIHRISYEVRDWRNQHLSGFHTKADDVLAVSPIAVVYALDWLGVPAKTDFWNRSVILAKAELLCLGTVYGLKYSTRELRPDGSDNRSFPSSHTAQAFMAATLLSEEYKDRFPWVPYAAYSLASGVGLMRIANNRHYLSDVLIGAGIGILSQKIAYWTHQYRWNKKRESVRF